MIEAKNLRNGKIAAVFDDILIVLDDDPADPYRKYLAKWEKQGGVIEPAKPATSLDDLTQYQDTTQ